MFISSSQIQAENISLESALRFYSTLTKGDTIEITYNSLTFEFLIMETVPEGPGIGVIDTDLEVDFATPVGYLEPPRPAPAPIPTMADKLKIDLGGTTSASAGSSRPASVASMRPGGSGDSTPLESFTGVGQSLSGKKVKGKGLAKKIEEVDRSSRINRNEWVGLSHWNQRCSSAQWSPNHHARVTQRYRSKSPRSTRPPRWQILLRVQIPPLGSEQSGQEAWRGDFQITKVIRRGRHHSQATATGIASAHHEWTAFNTSSDKSAGDRGAA